MQALPVAPHAQTFGSKGKLAGRLVLGAPAVRATAPGLEGGLPWGQPDGGAAGQRHDRCIKAPREKKNETIKQAEKQDHPK